MIRLHWLEWLPISLYLIGLLYLGLKHSHAEDHSEEGFIVGGRKLTLPAFVMTLVTTWYGGILGVGEFNYLYGIASWVVFGLPYYIFAILFAFFFAEKIQQSRFLTIPDQFFEHYGKLPGFAATAIAFFMTLPAPYILMIGFLIYLVTGWPLSTAIIVGTVFSSLYVLTGGFYAVVRTDKLQFLLMYGGFVIMLGMLVHKYGGIAFLTTHLPATHFNPTGGLSPFVLISWFLIAMWTFIDPGFYQRCYAARTPQIARKGILLSVGFWFIFDLLTTTVGLYSRAILTNAEPVLAYPLLSHLELPPLLSGIFFTALFATIMSTTDSYTLLGAITLGHDFLGRLPRFRHISRLALLRWGLLSTTAFSIALALLLPSVVQLWYIVGSLCIPPLLLPLLAVYYPQLKRSPRVILINIVGAFFLSTSWFMSAWLTSASGAQLSYPWDVQPMFPGLLFSFILFALTSRK